MRRDPGISHADSSPELFDGQAAFFDRRTGLPEECCRAVAQKVRQSGGGRKLLFLLLLVGVGFLFLNPKTGPQARDLAKQAYNSITSGG